MAGGAGASLSARASVTHWQPQATSKSDSESDHQVSALAPGPDRPGQHAARRRRPLQVASDSDPGGPMARAGLVGAGGVTGSTFNLNTFYVRLLWGSDLGPRRGPARRDSDSVPCQVMLYLSRFTNLASVMSSGSQRLNRISAGFDTSFHRDQISSSPGQISVFNDFSVPT